MNPNRRPSFAIANATYIQIFVDDRDKKANPPEISWYHSSFEAQGWRRASRRAQG